MTILESFRVAFEALAANKLRALLTMLGIIIGVGSVIAIIAIGRGTQAEIIGEIQGAGATVFTIQATQGAGGGPMRFVEPMTDSDVKRLKDSLPQLKAVFPFIITGGTFKAADKNDSGMVQVLAPEAFDAFGLKVDTGRTFTEDEARAGEWVCIIGSFYAETFFADKNPIGQSFYINNRPYTIVGVLSKSTGFLASLGGGNDRSVAIPLNTHLRTTSRRAYDQLFAVAPDKNSVNALAEDAKAVLQKAHPRGNFQTQSIQQVIDILTRVTNVLTAVISAIAGISLLVGGIGIMNIMLVSVTERTREIGIRKAIGARRFDILIQFVIEALVICLIGGAIGVALAAVPVFIVGKLLDLPLLVTWDAVLLALGFSIIVGLVFGFYPANKAARMDPIEALRYE